MLRVASLLSAMAVGAALTAAANAERKAIQIETILRETTEKYYTRVRV